MPYKDTKKRSEYRKAYRQANKARCSELQKNWYARNKDKARAKQKIWRDAHPRRNRGKPNRIALRKKYIALREFVNEYKRKTGCLNPRCPWIGEYSPEILDFHHIDRETKSFSIGSGHRSKTSTIKEIAKCTLVCANCHRSITWKTLDASEFPRCKA